MRSATKRSILDAPPSSALPHHALATADGAKAGSGLGRGGMMSVAGGCRPLDLAMPRSIPSLEDCV